MQLKAAIWGFGRAPGARDDPAVLAAAQRVEVKLEEPFWKSCRSEYTLCASYMTSWVGLMVQYSRAGKLPFLCTGPLSVVEVMDAAEPDFREYFSSVQADVLRRGQFDSESVLRKVSQRFPCQANKDPETSVQATVNPRTNIEIGEATKRATRPTFEVLGCRGSICGVLQDDGSVRP